MITWHPLSRGSNGTWRASNKFNKMAQLSYFAIASSFPTNLGLLNGVKPSHLVIGTLKRKVEAGMSYDVLITR